MPELRGILAALPSPWLLPPGVGANQQSLESRAPASALCNAAFRGTSALGASTAATWVGSDERRQGRRGSYDGRRLASQAQDASVGPLRSRLPQRLRLPLRLPSARRQPLAHRCRPQQAARGAAAAARLVKPAARAARAAAQLARVLPLPPVCRRQR